jgi:hypothetical protein
MLPIVVRAFGYCVGMLATLSAFVVGAAGAVAAVGTPVVSDVTPTHGPGAGGTVVTVSGSGFGADSTVSWAGSAPITPGSIAADGTSLTFTTPAHAPGVVDLRVTSGGATSEQPSPCSGTSLLCTATDAFWFEDVGGKPAPPVLSVLSDDPTREGSVFLFGRRIPDYSVTVYEEPAGDVACSIPATAEPIFKCGVDGLAVGVHHFQGTQSAPGGLTSDLSSAVDITVLEPIAPPTITSPRNGSTLDGPILHLAGTGLPGAELHVFSDIGRCVQIVSPSGRWSCTLALTSQPLQRTLFIAADQFVSGPPAGTSDQRLIKVTLQVPPPKITAPADGSVIPGPAKVKFSGSGVAIGVVTVTVYDNAKQICTATVRKSGRGSWTCTATLGIGSHSLTARQRDAFGNRSRSSQVVSLSVTAPALPQSTSHPELPATGTPIGEHLSLALALVLAGIIALSAGATRSQRRSSTHR